MRCTVEFIDNPNKAYYAGTTIYGRLIVTLSHERLVKGLSIQILGQARMKFKRGRSTDYIRENIVNEKHLVVSSAKLSAGEHSFTFESNLPPTCPASFESKGAKIRYKAIVIIPRMFLNKKVPFPFEVISNVHLPFFAANMPIRIQKRSSNSTSDCPKRYFRRGEYILVDIDVDAGLKMKSRTIEMYLMQYIGYKSKEVCFNIRNERDKKIEVTNFLFKTSDFQIKQSFLVPTDIPSSFEYLDDVLTVSYVFKVYVDGEKFKFSLVIGDVYKQP